MKFVQELHYLLALPEGYDADTSRRWPLLIFLHGSGESGTDLSKVKIHGPPKLVEEGKKFPFIVVSPQAPPQMGWQEEILYQLIQDIKRTQRVDKSRVYLTGLSMGGYGTWELAMKHPEEFAAIAPVCGGGDTSTAWKLRNLPVWNFHGAKDDVVFPIQSTNMVNAARRYNPAVKYTLYPEANHNSWDLTYDNDSLYTWMLAHKKFTYTEAPISATALKSYVGIYVGPDKDTVRLSMENGQLMASPGNEKFALKAAGNDLFFFQPDEPLDVRFMRTKGRVTSFLFMGREKRLFRKVK
ncbi:MAG: dienelactone hydrolase family protein [Chitinophagaceae bacterium]|nr:dienelactone hydrolase family protein [Chitinophagaceae bacterium]